MESQGLQRSYGEDAAAVMDWVNGHQVLKDCQARPFGCASQALASS